MYTIYVEAAFRFRSGAARLHSANLLRMRQRALRLRSLSSAISPLRGFAYLRIRKTYTYIYTIYVYVICISFLNTIISRKKFKFLLIFSDLNFWNFLENFRLQKFLQNNTPTNFLENSTSWKFLENCLCPYVPDIMYSAAVPYFLQNYLRTLRPHHNFSQN